MPSRLHRVFPEVCMALEESLRNADDVEGAAQALAIQSWHNDGNIHAAWGQAVRLLERVLGASVR